MSLSNLFANRILKVNLNGEMARLPLELSSNATCEEVFDHMRGCVQRAFNLSDEQMRGLMLKYADEEGDLCTMTDQTLGDLAQLFPEGVIRISATIEMPRAPAHHAQVMDVEHEPGEDMEGEQQASSSQEGNRWPVGNPMAKLAAQFSPLWLPKAAAELQSVEKQAKLDSVGKEKWEMLLPAFKRLYERIETVPEASHLKPNILPYIDGSDPDHLGRIVAELLEILAASDAKDAVMAIVEDFASNMMETHLNPMMDMFRRRSTDMGMQATASSEDATQVPMPSPMPDIAGLLGTMFAGKGLGKGMSESSGVPAAAFGMGTESSLPAQEAPRTGPYPVPDIAGLLGNVFAGKGCGKGAQFPSTSAADGSMGASAPSQEASHTSASPVIPNIAGLLGNIFAGKGLGKGVPSAPTPTASHSMAAQPSALPPEASGPLSVPDMVGLFNLLAGKGSGKRSQPIPAEAPQTSMFEQEVKDLIDMGLASDEQVARDLLNANDGDLSKVVDILTS